MKKLYTPGLVLFIFVIFLNILLGSSQTLASPLSPQAAVEQAWALARTSGRYSYRSLIDQTIYPAPAVTNAALPPPLPHFSPIAKIPPHHLTLLPVPRVPFMSQVCQLAMMMTHAAATDSYPPS